MRKASLLIVLVAITLSSLGQTKLIAFGASWKYLDNGSNQGTAWFASSFDDDNWKNGPSNLGYGQGDEATVVGYGTNAKEKYITTYFRNTFSIEDASLFSNYTLKFKLDDGMVVYCNGKEVYRNNMPSGTITYTTVASSKASDDGKTTKTVNLSNTILKTGTNVMAVEVHQCSKSSSDISFNMEVLGNAAAQTAGFKSITNLSHVAVSVNTGEKPQSKVWSYDGKHWAVLTNGSGTYLWRLNGTSWTSVLRLSTKTSSKADCKKVGGVTHIFLYQGRSSQLVSVEYDATHSTYKLWSKRTSTVGISLEDGTETATIDMDSHGRMWLANAGTTHVYVRWSDAPYNNWSAPISLVSNIKDDDICAVVALPGKIGVLWSNQTTQRFGFRFHKDGAAPSDWSADEVPASQSALNIGGGMADDHLNMAVASNGTLYCAVKTAYDNHNYPLVCLLVRHADGSWSKLYNVASVGTRPIVLLNESIGKVRVVYAKSDNGGSILYKESALSSISFSPELTLISGTALNNATSTKDNFTSEVVIFSSTSSEAVGVLASDGSSTPAEVQQSQPGPIVTVEPPAPVPANTSIVRVFPTQVKRGYSVTVQSGTNEESEIVVTDNNGRVIQTSRFSGNTQVYTNQLADGIYYILLNNKASVKTYRFMVVE